LSTTFADRPCRILVVDDEIVVWEVIRNTLERPGRYLVYAPDGEKAISLALEEHFDLLIVDKNLPGITGLDVIRRAKSHDANIATLLITAYASRESAEEAMAIGVDDYLVKPFDVADLEDKVIEVLDSREKRKGRSIRSRPATTRCRVLICESDERIGRLMQEGVELLGHKAISVSKVSKILESLRAKDADALICELEILQRDNAEACFLRSTLLIHPEVNFIAVAMEHGLEGAVEAIHQGAQKVLYRPFLKKATDIARELEPFLGKTSGRT
jgi:DNA-binding NtrC family response regulator